MNKLSHFKQVSGAAWINPMVKSLGFGILIFCHWHWTSRFVQTGLRFFVWKINWIYCSQSSFRLQKPKEMESIPLLSCQGRQTFCSNGLPTIPAKLLRVSLLKLRVTNTSSSSLDFQEFCELLIYNSIHYIQGLGAMAWAP